MKSPVLAISLLIISFSVCAREHITPLPVPVGAFPLTASVSSTRLAPKDGYLCEYRVRIRGKVYVALGDTCDTRVQHGYIFPARIEDEGGKHPKLVMNIDRIGQLELRILTTRPEAVQED